MLASALATAVLLGTAFVLPENFPAFPLGILPVIAMRAIAVQRQRALLDAHFGAGGRRASTWAAAGIGLASIVIVMIPVFTIGVVWCSRTGNCHE